MVPVYWLALSASLVVFLYAVIYRTTSSVLALYSFAFFSSFALPWHLVGVEQGPAAFRTAVFLGALGFFVSKVPQVGVQQRLCLVALLGFSAIWCVLGLVGVLAGNDGVKTLSFFYRILLPLSVLLLAWPFAYRNVTPLITGGVVGALLMSLYVSAYGGLTFGGRAYIVGGTAETITIGRVIGVGFVFALALIYARDDMAGSKRLIWLTLPILAWGLLFAGSRAPVLGVGIVVLLCLVGYWRWSLKRSRWGVAFGLPLLAFVLLTAALTQGLPQSMGKEEVRGVMRGLGAGEMDQNAADRVYLYGEAVKLAAARPLGIGLGQYEQVGSHRYPHNIFLELAVEGGVLLAVTFLGLLVSVGVCLLGMLSRRQLLPSLILFGLTYSTVNASFSFSIDRNEQFWLFLALGILWCATPKKRGLCERSSDERQHY